MLRRGEDVVKLKLSRRCSDLKLADTIGVIVTVKVHPVVEEFMRSLGDGGSQPIDVAHGRGWYEIGEAGPILVWNMDKPLDKFQTRNWTIDKPSASLQDEKYGHNNLSWLRIVGVSKGEGVTFGVKGVYSTTGLNKLRESFGTSLDDFYKSYIIPVDMYVSMTIQDGRSAY